MRYSSAVPKQRFCQSLNAGKKEVWAYAGEELPKTGVRYGFGTVSGSDRGGSVRNTGQLISWFWCDYLVQRHKAKADGKKTLGKKKESRSELTLVTSPARTFAVGSHGMKPTKAIG